MAPNRYTELFFLDEATALAAGHRPCFECRRQDFLRFATVWAQARGETGRARAPGMDRVLHADRVDAEGNKVMWHAPLAVLPDGAMVRVLGAPQLVLGHQLLPWSHDGYGEARTCQGDTSVDVLTPRSIVAVLSAGYSPSLHPTASSALPAVEGTTTR